jgi:hypothetical protein
MAIRKKILAFLIVTDLSGLASRTVAEVTK